MKSRKKTISLDRHIIRVGKANPDRPLFVQEVTGRLTEVSLWNLKALRSVADRSGGTAPGRGIPRTGRCCRCGTEVLIIGRAPVASIFWSREHHLPLLRGYRPCFERQKLGAKELKALRAGKVAPQDTFLSAWSCAVPKAEQAHSKEERELLLTVERTNELARTKKAGKFSVVVSGVNYRITHRPAGKRTEHEILAGTPAMAMSALVGFRKALGL